MVGDSWNCRFLAKVSEAIDAIIVQYSISYYGILPHYNIFVSGTQLEFGRLGASSGIGDISNNCNVNEQNSSGSSE